MFHQSYEQLSFKEQVIVLNQTYPCPRCSSGLLELYGLTETLQCNGCRRIFVPLRRARLLHPAKCMGARIAPVFWWDGLRWHWAGTTATGKQIAAILSASILPIVLVNLVLTMNFWPARPEWCSPILLSVVVGLIMLEVIYLVCWDFDTMSREKSKQ